jgi:hypothetical protein
MISAGLADLTILLHLAFVVFVVAGGLLVRRWPRLLFAHLAAAAWGVFIAATGGICPLTPLENWLSEQAGRAGYRGGFLEHYLGPVLYPEGLTREVQWGEAAMVVLVNGIVYGPFARRWWRRRVR